MSVAGTAPSEFQHKTGERLGKYVLDKQLGLGGFAEVWTAVEDNTDRTVALKIFSDKATSDPILWPIICDEPRKQARLENERIVPIYYCHLDLDGRSGPFYIAMKWMSRGSLELLLEQRGKLPPTESVHIIREILQGLKSAHAAGIIHRDISPSNIMFDASGHPALADFGIAKDLTKSDGTKTLGPGAVVGKPDYMSPEQGAGKPVTEASDIYSLGTVLYEMLVGRRPFDGPTDLAVIVAKSNQDPPSLRATVPEIPERLEKVVLNALERNLDHRYADCDSFLRALDWATSRDEDIRPEPKPSTVRRKYALWGGIAALILVSLGVGYQAMRPKANQKKVIEHIPWSSVMFGDSRLKLDCLGYLPCVMRENLASQLAKMTADDWYKQPYNSRVFTDCMDHPQCVERSQHAKLLQATNWQALSKNDPRSKDCMNYGPCLGLKMPEPSAQLTPTPPHKNRPTGKCNPGTDPLCGEEDPGPLDLKDNQHKVK